MSYMRFHTRKNYLRKQSSRAILFGKESGKPVGLKKVNDLTKEDFQNFKVEPMPEIKLAVDYIMKLTHQLRESLILAGDTIRAKVAQFEESHPDLLMDRKKCDALQHVGEQVSDATESFSKKVDQTKAHMEESMRKLFS